MAAMKDSGVEWIGEIPGEWETSKFKYCAKVDYGFPADSIFFNAEGNGIPLIRIRDVTSGEVATWYSGSYPKELVVNPGDMLIGMDGDFGLRTWRGPRALLNQRCCRVHGGTMDDRYLFHCMSFPLAQINELTVSTTVKHLLSDDIANIELPIPMLCEQQLIGLWLDRECEKIDKAVSPLEKQISTLERYRTSLIHEAVTKGLDPTAPMKPSGVDWIGDIPEDWVLTKLQQHVYLRARLGWKGLKADEYVDEGYPLYSAFNIVENKFIQDNCDYINEKRYKESPEIMLSEGDVLLVKDGAGYGKHAFVSNLKRPSTVNGSIAVLTPDTELEGRYLNYSLESKVFKHQSRVLLTGMGVPHLTQHFLKNLLLTLPPLKEQMRIADYLDARTAAIDAVLETKRKQLDVLKKRRQSLIYEYVTGKRRVNQED